MQKYLNYYYCYYENDYVARFELQLAFVVIKISRDSRSAAWH